MKMTIADIQNLRENLRKGCDDITELVKSSIEEFDVEFEQTFPATAYIVVENNGNKYKMAIDVRLLRQI